MNDITQKSIFSIVAIYGCFAILCHLCGILLFFSVNKAVFPHALLLRQCAQMLEYTAMSAVVLIIGCFLIYYVTYIEARK